MLMFLGILTLNTPRAFFYVYLYTFIAVLVAKALIVIGIHAIMSILIAIVFSMGLHTTVKQYLPIMLFTRSWDQVRTAYSRC